MALAGLVGMTGDSNSVPPVPGFQGADAAGAMQVCLCFLNLRSNSA